MWELTVRIGVPLRTVESHEPTHPHTRFSVRPSNRPPHPSLQEMTISLTVPDVLVARARTGDLEALEALYRALERLSETSRAVVWLHDVEGYTHEEIAELMGKTVSFSKSQLARAHARLRRTLEPGLKEGGA